MALVGFHFKSMSVEKKKTTSGKINVTNNISVTDVKEAKLNMGAKKEKGVEFTFLFKSSFEPDYATLELTGAVVYVGPEDNVKEILDSWNKDKTVSKSVLSEVYNHTLTKCNIQALTLEKDMGLPAHIPLPKIKGA